MNPLDVVETALAVDREQLARLSDAELLALCDAVAGVTGEVLVKAEDREVAITRGLADELESEYVAGVEAAADAEFADLPETDASTDEVGLALAGVDRRLAADLEGDRGERMRGTLVAALSVLALVGRRRGRAAVGATGRPTAEISGSLTQADRSAMQALSGQQLWWIGDFWGAHLSRTIAATVAREALVRGLGRAEVGRILRGVVAGTTPAPVVPGTFRGGPGPYFRMLAGTVRNQASNYGALSTFVEGGVERYRIVAVLDERTSEICNYMHGRTFAVRTGVRLAADRLEADSPDAARAVSPWRSADEARTIAGSGEGQDDALARAGMALPPYHGGCRTTVAPD